MNYRYVFIAPYSEMADMAQEVVSDLDLKEWAIVVGNVDEGLKKAKQFVEKGARIIVSRSMTAKVISEKVDIPVIDLGASPYDIVTGLGEASLLGKKIGVIGGPELVYDCHILEEPMHIKIVEIPITSPEQIDTQIINARENGVEVILGGLNEIHCAESHGLKGVLLHTGRSTIAIAMKKAIEMVDINYKEKIRAQRFQTILDHSYEGILSTDGNGKVILINRTAKMMLKLDHDPIGQSAKEILPKNLMEDIINEKNTNSSGTIFVSGNDRIIVNSRSIRVEGEFNGIVMTLQYVKDIEKMEINARKQVILKGHVASVSFSDIIANSEIMKETISFAKRYAVTDSTILITGETGVGKEMFAQSIHNASKRSNGPFVAINCASIPENLLESELFGYEEGSFTGARKTGKKGYFEIANNGTLFLDEIGEIPLNLQANLLRVLQEKQIMRVGSDRVTPINVRIITATHRDLERATLEGTFRLDLFYRINILRLVIPPIRERISDIIPLAQALIQTKSHTLNIPPFELNDEACDLLKTYPWRGNVRELENVIERLCILYSGSIIDNKDLQSVLFEMDFSHSQDIFQKKGTIQHSEKQLILETLTEMSGNRSKTAKALGISTTTLWRKMKEYQIQS